MVTTHYRIIRFTPEQVHYYNPPRLGQRLKVRHKNGVEFEVPAHNLVIDESPADRAVDCRRFRTTTLNSYKNNFGHMPRHVTKFMSEDGELVGYLAYHSGIEKLL